MLVKYIIKVFLYLILAVMTLIRWLLKIPMMLGNILLYFLSIIFILTVTKRKESLSQPSIISTISFNCHTQQFGNQCL